MNWAAWQRKQTSITARQREISTLTALAALGWQRKSLTDRPREVSSIIAWQSSRMRIAECTVLQQLHQ